MEVNTLLLALTGLLGLLALIWALRIERLVTETDRSIRRAMIHQRELAQLMEIHQQLSEYQDFTESFIDNGTATVRSLHREIANIPFEILESIPTTRDSTRVVRGVHDLTADGVYASISTLNKLMGKRLRKQMKLENGKENDPQDK